MALLPRRPDDLSGLWPAVDGEAPRLRRPLTAPVGETPEDTVPQEGTYRRISHLRRAAAQLAILLCSDAPGELVSKRLENAGLPDDADPLQVLLTQERAYIPAAEAVVVDIIAALEPTPNGEPRNG